MKRLLSLFLVFLFLCPLFTLPGHAAVRGRLTLTGSAEALDPSDAFEIGVKLERNPGLVQLRAAVRFDPKVLVFDKAEDQEVLPGFRYDQKEGELVLRWESDQDVTATGILVKLRFFVKSDAIFGDSSVSVEVSERLYDAQNSSGEPLPFGTQGIAFALHCSHREFHRVIVRAPSFELEGAAKETCDHCGKETEISLPPILEGKDGSFWVTLSVGEYLDSDEKSVEILYLQEKEELSAAETLFGDSLLCAFRFQFTKNGEPFIPAKLGSIALNPAVELPEGFALYLLSAVGAQQVEFQQDGETLLFPYEDLTYVLVEREQTEPQLPEATTTTTAATATTTRDPAELARRRDQILIAAGSVVLVLCGVGAILILSRKKRY